VNFTAYPDALSGGSKFRGDFGETMGSETKVARNRFVRRGSQFGLLVVAEDKDGNSRQVRNCPTGNLDLSRSGSWDN